MFHRGSPELDGLDTIKFAEPLLRVGDGQTPLISEVPEKLAEELRRFAAEAERVARLGWEPDLDDGIMLCAAPLADLFLSWSDATTTRTELRKGKHEWATVASWADQL